ncbi:MAG: hypothetical protein JWP91_279 [Fibrobacteres bacterium]|nr:hypothetical protein [Fibrobacterota bacterium]
MDGTGSPGPVPFHLPVRYFFLPEFFSFTLFRGIAAPFHT